MTHTLDDSEYAGRHTIARNAEMGDILTEVGTRIDALKSDIHGQLHAVLDTLSPSTFPEVCSLPAGATRDFPVGVAGTAILHQITLVKINPGSFPSSVSIRHDDLPGHFLLDSTQLSIELDITQIGVKYLHLTNNDAAIDCAVIASYRRMD